MHLNRVQRIYLFTFFVGFSVYCRSHFICDMHRCFCWISAHFFLSLSPLRFEYEMQMHSRHQRTDEHEIQCNRILAQETRAARCAAFIIGHFRLPINYNIDFILFSNFHSTSHLYVRFGFMLLCDIVSVVVCVPFAFAGQSKQTIVCGVVMLMKIVASVVFLLVY